MITVIVVVLVVGAAVGGFLFAKNSPKHAQAIQDKSREQLNLAADKAKLLLAKKEDKEEKK